MTIIAWDGKVLAADKMMNFGSSKAIVTKIFKIGDVLAGFAGHGATGMELIEWVRGGRFPEYFPESQRGSNSGSLLIVERNPVRHRVLHYSTGPFPMIVHDYFYAIGTGDEFALAAMFLGKNAIEAVEVACALCPTCGNGIDTLTFDN